MLSCGALRSVEIPSWLAVSRWRRISTFRAGNRSKRICCVSDLNQARGSQQRNQCNLFHLCFLE